MRHVTHTQLQIILLPLTGHAHLAEPGCLCTKHALWAVQVKLLELRSWAILLIATNIGNPEVPPGPLPCSWNKACTPANARYPITSWVNPIGLELQTQPLHQHSSHTHIHTHNHLRIHKNVTIVIWERDFCTACTQVRLCKVTIKGAVPNLIKCKDMKSNSLFWYIKLVRLVKPVYICAVQPERQHGWLPHALPCNSCAHSIRFAEQLLQMKTQNWGGIITWTLYIITAQETIGLHNALHVSRAFTLSNTLHTHTHTHVRYCISDLHNWTLYYQTYPDFVDTT